MLESGWNLGAYGYFDVRRSSLGNTFHQATFGVEALSEFLDLRANVYLPLGDREKTIDLGSWSSTSISSAPVLTGTQLGIQTVSTTTTGTATLVEKAMRGVDAEIGVRLPVFPEALKLDFRALAGFYHFEADGMRDVSGPRGRLELTARDFAGVQGLRLTGGLTWQDDDVRGEQLIASARLSIPLHAPRKTLPDLSYMESRMTDPVVRDVDIVADSKTETSTTTTTATNLEAAVNIWNDETITSVVQVDGAGGQAALQAMLDGVGTGGVVIANGDFAASASTEIPMAVTLLGGGTNLRVRGATTGVEVDFTAPGATGKLEGDVPAWVVNLAGDRAVIGGMTVRTGAEVVQFGILANGPTGVVAFGNTVEAVAGTNSIAILFSNIEDSNIYGNTITADGHGIYTDKSTNLRISNNTILSSKDDAVIIYYGINATIAGNIFSAGNHGPLFTANSTSLTEESVGNVDQSGAFRCALFGFSFGSGSVQFTDGVHCSY